VARPVGPLFDSRGPLEEKGGGGRLGPDGEGTVFKYGNLRGDDQPLLSGGQLVIFLTESEQVDSRRREVLPHFGRIGFSGFQLQFQRSDHVFSHVSSPFDAIDAAPVTYCKG
jgi:hypothetical protein